MNNNKGEFMKGLIIAIFTICLVFLSGCGKRNEEKVITIAGPTKTVNVYQSFEGTYFFDNGGFIELLHDNDNQVSILADAQELVTINPNGTLAEHIKFSRNNVLVLQDKVYLSMDMTYNYVNGVLDDNGNWIVGAHKTDIVMEKSGDKLDIHIQIYENKTQEERDEDYKKIQERLENL